VRGALAGLVLGLVACGGDAKPSPQGQILLFVDTDAPLPAAPGSLAGANDPPPLFDRLRIEVRRAEEPSAPPLARHDFPIDRGSFAHGLASVGIAPSPYDEGLVAQARLYRSVDVRSGEISPSSTIDVSQRLPPVTSDEVLKVLIELHMDDTGQPQQHDEASPVAEVPERSAVGSWPGATIVPCMEPPADGEACVSGGAFWMGDPELRDDREVANAEREHLVVVSPFYIDTHEVTVGEFRELAAELGQAGAELPPSWSGGESGQVDDDYSTYTPGPSDQDAADVHATLPVNAVSWETAQAYCEMLGKQLPTEAMFEFLTSGRGLEHKYVWGNEEPECDDAVAARAGFGVYITYEGDCRPAGSIGGVLAVGSAQRDEVKLGDAAVVDLAGNLSEWTFDWFNAEDEGVWATPGLLVDPVALEQGVAGERRSIRGSWRGRYVQLRAAARLGREPQTANRALGFRCARRP
jgi:formylglycine-generating enzyme required for sulfatase activity